MARADSASASAHSDSIKGLAQAVARPAYRRLLTAEPFLRRAVPVLIVAFLVTLGVAAVVDIRERLRQAIFKSADELDLAATVMAERMERLALSESGEPVVRAFRAFERIDWPRATAGRPPGSADRRQQHHHLNPARAQRLYRPQAQRGDRPRSHHRAHRDPSRRVRGHARRRIGHSAGAPESRQPARPARDHSAPRRRARRMACRHHARRHAVLGDRLRGADARLRVPLAVAPDARDRQHRGHRAQPYRHRAQLRPLRTVGLGSRQRARVLVAVDVRHSGATAVPQAARASARSAGWFIPDDVQLYELAGELADSGNSSYRPRVPHAPCERQLGLAAHALRAGAQARRAASPPHRNRGRHHRAEAPRRGERHRRDAA